PTAVTTRRLSGLNYVEFSPDSRRVVTAVGLWDTERGEARVWDAVTGAPVTPFLRHRQGISEAHFSPDGRRVLTASADGTAQLWDAASGKPVAPPLQHQGSV